MAASEDDTATSTRTSTPPPFLHNIAAIIWKPANNTNQNVATRHAEIPRDSTEPLFKMPTFFDLPPELCNAIYYHVLVNENEFPIGCDPVYMVQENVAWNAEHLAQPL